MSTPNPGGASISARTRTPSVNLARLAELMAKALEPTSTPTELLFRAEEGHALTIEMRDRNRAFQPVLILLDEQNNELVRAEMSASGEDGNIAAIANWVAPSNHIYTLIASRRLNFTPHSNKAMRRMAFFLPGSPP